MLNVPKHLIVELPPEEAQSLLSEWLWFLSDGKRVLLVSASGDLFLADPNGRVFWLETGSGRLTQVASSVADFEAALANEANQVEWLLEPIVGELRAQGVSLAPGQCYGFCMPAVLGGAYDGDNRVAVSVREHFGFTGYLHGKMKDLPDGTQVKLKWE